MTTKFVSIKQMREIDKKAVQYGMPIELMMENAGRELSGIVLKKLNQRKLKKVLVVAGKGNNAGGVIAASRHLSSNGISVTLIVLGVLESLTRPTRLNLDLVRKNKRIKIIFMKDLEQILREVRKAKIILDGIFGIGFNRGISPPFDTIMSEINDSQAYIISNDVPSGINADSGKRDSVAIDADHVVVLHKPKKWMKYCQPSYSVVNIGIPPEISQF